MTVPAVRLSLLGGFTLRLDDRPVRVHDTGARLLAMLALAGGQSVSRTVAAERICAGDADRAGARLRSVLWRLPKSGEQRLVDGSGALRLAEHVEVDVWRAEHDARELTSGEHDVPDLRGFGADLLPDWADDWLLLEREAFRQTRLHALERASVRLCRAGRFDAALQAALTAVGCEPLRETAHRCVVEVHLAEGNPAEALRQYQTYRRLLAVELGLVPSQAIRSLLAPLLGRPADHFSRGR